MNKAKRVGASRVVVWKPGTRTRKLSADLPFWHHTFTTRSTEELGPYLAWGRPVPSLFRVAHRTLHHNVLGLFHVVESPHLILLNIELAS